MSKELTQQLIGKVLLGEVERDAIHIAVAPMVARVRLAPGQHVDATGSPVGTMIGIVDPFLSDTVMPGQRVFIFLYPNTITGLRHEWTHPAFSGNAPVKAVAGTPEQVAEARLREIAAGVDVGYRQMMRAAENWLDYGEYEVQQGAETWRDEFPQFTVEFWALYEIVTGKRIPIKKRASFFSCSC